jgi:hypothetical protein
MVHRRAHIDLACEPLARTSRTPVRYLPTSMRVEEARGVSSRPAGIQPYLSVALPAQKRYAVSHVVLTGCALMPGRRTVHRVREDSATLG